MKVGLSFKYAGRTYKRGKAFARAFARNLNRVTRQAAWAAMRRLRRDVVPKIRQSAPVGKTGRLKRSIRARIFRMDRWPALLVRAGTRYSLFVEKGTKNAAARPFFYKHFDGPGSEINALAKQNFGRFFNEEFAKRYGRRR